MYDILRLSATTRSHRQLYDNFRLDIFVREVKDIVGGQVPDVYIWYAFTTMVCSAVLWHEQLMKYVCTTHNQCYGTGFPNPVHTVFKQGYTC